MAEQGTPSDESFRESEESRAPIVIFLLASALTLLLWLLSSNVDSGPLRIMFLLCQVVMISIVIWQACDPFADAAQWIGRTLHIPGSVRGATLDAIASSMPELFTGIFFVVLAMVGTENAELAASHSGGEGFAATLATCAGSAVYNMMLIPAICALFVSIYRPERPSIDIEDKVIARDGVWFMGCELVLIYFLFQDAMHWWMALVLLGLYAVYVWFLYRDARLYRRVQRAIRSRIDANTSVQDLIDGLHADGIHATRSLVEEVREELFGNSDTADADENDNGNGDDADEAGFLFGKFSVKLNHTTAWTVIAISTLFAAAACYWLVEVTTETATELNVPLFFVAVILAAAASSVPDTFLSVGAARRGDDDGAVSNAFGSNIFDICICLTIPLLVGSYLNGWQPIEMSGDGSPIPGLYGLRILLCALSLITLLIMWHNRRLTRNKAIVLCGLYMIFVAYAIAGSFGFTLQELMS